MLLGFGELSEHSFDAPLGLLSDCHRRIEYFIEVLVVVADVRRGATLAPRDRIALEGALDYFRTVAPKHAADEEQSLFPRLRSSTDAAARQAIARLDALEADHRLAEDHQDAADVLGQRWLRAGTLEAGDARSLREHLVALQRLYHRHIGVEDHELFPVAGRLLSPADLAAIGREMAARRRAAAPDGSLRAS